MYIAERPLSMIICLAIKNVSKVDLLNIYGPRSALSLLGHDLEKPVKCAMAQNASRSFFSMRCFFGYLIATLSYMDD